MRPETWDGKAGESDEFAVAADIHGEEPEIMLANVILDTIEGVIALLQRQDTNSITRGSPSGGGRDRGPARSRDEESGARFR